MAQPPSPSKQVSNPRIAKLIELETRGVIKPEHLTELNTYRNQGLAPEGKGLTETQSKNSGFYARAVEADRNFVGTKSATDPRNDVERLAADTLPTGLVNWASGDDRQLSEQAKRNFIAATLRAESGAAIGDDEYRNQEKIFFPQAGEGADVIAQKARDRQVAIDALKSSAGPGADRVRLPDDQPAPPPTEIPTNWRVPGADTGGGDIGFADKAHDEANSLPDGAQQFQTDLSFAISNGTLKTPEDIIAFGKTSKANGGRGFDIDADQAAKVIESVKKGGGFNVNTPQFQAPDISADRGEGGAGEGVKAFGRGLLNAAGVDDEVGAVADTFSGGTLRDNLAKERAIRDYDEEKSPWLRGAGTLVGSGVLGLAMPGSVANTARTEAVGVLRAGGTRRAAEIAARYGVAKRMGIEGATLGGIYGVGASDGDLGDRAVSGVEGAIAGGVTGYGMGSLAHLAGVIPRGTPPAGNAVMEAADRINVPVVTADVRPGARGATSLLESIPGSSGVVNARLQAGTNAMENVVASLGPAGAERTATGEAVQQGAQNWVRRSGGTGSRLYTRAEQLASGQQVAPTEALQAIDTHLGELGQTPGTNNTKIALLQRLRGDLVDADGNPRPLGIGAIRDLRTGMREEINASNIRSSDMDRRLGSVMDAANTDIRAGLANNPRALAAYDRADQFWRQRAERVDNVLSSVIGKADNPLSGEQVMSKIEGMAAPKTGNSARLDTLLNSLRPDEREQVAGTIAGALGRTTPDADFSAQRLFTQINKISPRARVAMFGQDGADALTDLATVAEARAGTVARLNNSGSGRVSNYLQTIKGLIGIGGGAGIGAAAGMAGTGAAVTAAGLAGANITARVLTNPAMARWFARGLRQTSLAGARAQIGRLGQIANTNPTIRNEVMDIQQKLLAAVNDNAGSTGRAAASPDERPAQQQ